MNKSRGNGARSLSNYLRAGHTKRGKKQQAVVLLVLAGE